MFYKIHGIRALIYHNKKLLILKRASNDKDDAGLWDVPGGAIRSNETIFEAIKREVLEETGIKSSDLIINNSKGLIIDNFENNKKLVIAIFQCESRTDKIRLNDEHKKYCWVNNSKISSYRLGRILKAAKNIL